MTASIHHINSRDFDWHEWLEREKEDARLYIKPLESYTDKIIARLDTQHPSGDVMPWQITHDLVRLRMKEVSIWAGINGHGKSQMLGMVTSWLLTQNPVLIASFEMPVEATGARMIRQCSGVRDPSRQFVEKYVDYTFGHLWMYDEDRTVSPDRIYALIAYAAQELHCKHIVIDSLLKCGINGDDLGGQKAFVDKLCQIAKRYSIHIHLVHHMRKGEREGKVPDKFDVRGASEIVDLVDNLFIVHRNKDKENKVAMRQPVDVSIPDASLIVGKQRHGEWEGKIQFWFHRASMQYVKSPDAPPMPWPSPENQWLQDWEIRPGK